MLQREFWMEQKFKVLTILAQKAVQLLWAVQMFTDVFCRYSQLTASPAAFIKVAWVPLGIFCKENLAHLKINEPSNSNFSGVSMILVRWSVFLFHLAWLISLVNYPMACGSVGLCKTSLEDKALGVPQWKTRLYHDTYRPHVFASSWCTAYSGQHTPQDPPDGANHHSCQKEGARGLQLLDGIWQCLVIRKVMLSHYLTLTLPITLNL